MDSKMLLMALVPLIVWIGLFMFVLSLDRKLSRLEQSEDVNDL